VRAVGIRLVAAVLPLIGGVALVLAGSPFPARPVFLVLAPALAVLVAPLPVDALARLLLAVSAVVIINGVTSEVMLASSVWSPTGGTLVVALASSLLWAAPAAHELRRRRSRARQEVEVAPS
jgi:asparagine N-glycosylation enzyme membrane subunit Stt3